MRASSRRPPRCPGRPTSQTSDGGATGWCLEPHDLALSKLAAHREKDKAFVGSLIAAGLLDIDILRERVGRLEASGVEIAAVRREIEAWG